MEARSRIDETALLEARIILGMTETEIASLLAKVSELDRNNEVVMHLRATNMLYEAIKQKGGMVIVPSTAVQTMGPGGMLATTALASASNSGSGGVPGAVAS